MNIVIFGLTITSSWGNGHATTYRALVKELAARGHAVLFLERDVPWYAAQRDLPAPPFGETRLYGSLEEIRRVYLHRISSADLVIVGSYVPQGVAVGELVLAAAGGITAFYDIDTPVTLAKLTRGECDYLTPDLLPRFDLYLSFTGGPVLRHLERNWGAQRARALYCSVDHGQYFPEQVPVEWDLGYLGTYSADRQPALEQLLIGAASQWPGGRFVVAGPQYPDALIWPLNTHRIEHLPPPAHRRFYNAQRFTLNITRSDMVRLGHSPSVRLFEAAACGIPIITDDWPGLDSFFQRGADILVSHSPEETLAFLREMPEEERRRIAGNGRTRILAEHTGAHRAAELERLVASLRRSHSAGSNARRTGI